jgi:hypothetical protein
MILNKIGAKSVNKFWPIRMLRVFLIKNAGDYRRLPPIEGVQHPLSKLPVLHCRTWRSWICMKLKLYLSWGTWVFRQFYLIHLLNLQWCKYVHVCVYAYACMCMYVYIYVHDMWNPSSMLSFVGCKNHSNLVGFTIELPHHM